MIYFLLATAWAWVPVLLLAVWCGLSEAVRAVQRRRVLNSAPRGIKALERMLEQVSA